MASSPSLSRLIFAGCILLLTTAIPAGAVEPWENTVSPFAPPSFSEPRSVRLQYNFGWNGVTAATADFHFSKNGDGQFQLEATGHTIGPARSLWSYETTHLGISDGRTLRPIQVRETESARSKTWQTQLDFSPAGVTSRRDQQGDSSRKSKTRHFDFGNVHSLDSALLYLRARPLAQGTVERFVVYPSTSAYLCTVTVVGKERITIPTSSYEAIKLDLQLNKIGKKRELLPHKKFKHASVWISDDPDRLILRIETQIFIGTVFAELQSVQFDHPRP